MLLSGRPVVVNLEGLTRMMHREIMDFISGYIYSIKGQYHQISKICFHFHTGKCRYQRGPVRLDGSSAKMPTINREF